MCFLLVTYHLLPSKSVTKSMIFSKKLNSYPSPYPLLVHYIPLRCQESPLVGKILSWVSSNTHPILQAMPPTQSLTIITLIHPICSYHPKQMIFTPPDTNYSYCQVNRGMGRCAALHCAPCAWMQPRALPWALPWALRSWTRPASPLGRCLRLVCAL